MKHVASHAGVSTATVSRVINGHTSVAEATRRRVLQAMDQLGYSPSVAAQALVTKGKTRQIGVVVHKIDHPFYADFASAFHIEAAQHGYASLLLEAQGMSLVEILRDLRARQVEGVVLAVEDLPERTTNEMKSEYERLIQSGIPIVVVDEVCGRGIAVFPVGVGTVPVAVYEGARALTDHLVQLGHRHIGFIAPGQPLDGQRNLRYRAYKEQLKEARLLPGPTSNESWDMTSLDHVIRQALEAMLNQGPCTAIMAYNDIFAMVILKILADLNVRVPDDMSVTGFDDLAFARYAAPPLTTVRIHRKKMGREAFIALNAQMTTRDGFEAKPIQYELVVRASTASPFAAERGSASWQRAPR